MASADNEAALRSWGVDADALNNNQQIVVTAEEDMMLRQVSVHPSLPPSLSVPRQQLPQKDASLSNIQCC